MPTETRRRPDGFFGGEPRSASSDSAVPVYRFLGPSYWKTWFFIGWLAFTSLLPWRWSLALHRRFGRWLGGKSRKSVRLVEDNLQRCFPEMDEAQRAAVIDEYFANMGAIVTELGLAWFRPLASVRQLIEIEGAEHLARALEHGSGVILYVGHFTTIEVCGVGIGKVAPNFVISHNKRRSQLLSEYQRRRRDRYSSEVFAKHNVRGLIRALKGNAVLWFSGDEAHAGKSSAMLPFFGGLAPTNTALSRLAKISGAKVVPLAYWRKPDNSGYVLRFDAALEDFPSEDVIADTQRLVAILEDQIRAQPAQYFWKQKRFGQKRDDSDRD